MSYNIQVCSFGVLVGVILLVRYFMCRGAHSTLQSLRPKLWVFLLVRCVRCQCACDICHTSMPLCSWGVSFKYTVMLGVSYVRWHSSCEVWCMTLCLWCVIGFRLLVWSLRCHSHSTCAVGRGSQNRLKLFCLLQHCPTVLITHILHIGHMGLSVGGCANAHLPHPVRFRSTYHKVWVKGWVLHYKPGAIGNQTIW